MTATAAFWFLPVVIPIAIYVSWTDMSAMKIKNHAMITLFFAFVILGPFALGFPAYFLHLLHAPIVLVIGMLLWGLRLMGAGDAKMFAAMAPYFAASDGFLLAIIFVAASFAGLLVHSVFRFTPLRNLAPDWQSWTAQSDKLRGGIFGLKMTFPKGLILSMTLVYYLVLVAMNR